jgi:hypothetical protein
MTEGAVGRILGYKEVLRSPKKVSRRSKLLVKETTGGAGAKHSHELIAGSQARLSGG